MGLKSLRRHEGWLLIDHTASPGIPADIARRIGLDPRQVGEGKKLEAATITCKHCGNAYLARPERNRDGSGRERHYCRLCDHYICDDCKARSLLPGYVHQCKEAKFEAALRSASIIIP